MPGLDLGSIEVKKVAGGAGAEILHVDLNAVDDATVHKIREAFLDNGVVFFRNQKLTPQEFLEFSAKFGKPIEYPFVKGIDGYPEIIQVLKRENEKVNFGGVWHSDTAYLDEPPMGTILMARELPPYGGDTMWSNQYAAYEALSEGLKKVLDGLRCCQSSAKADASNTREDRLKDLGKDDVKNYVVYHPVVRTHPETGRKALFCNVAHTTQFEGWTEEESQPLLQYLFQHQIKPEFTCRFKWKPGSIAFWDNRCVQHYPINDYHGHKRLMHRITLAGDVPK
jgi:taurine dioxygenase